MLSREQVNTMLVLRQRKNSLFSTLPTELIREIIGWENGDIAKALQYAAYARKEDVEALFKMLEADPNLLLDAGHVKTPGGDEIRNVTIYEFALGAGDYELAESVQRYFSKIKDGEKHRIRQYERYKPHIEGMLNQEPYDLTPLIKLMKKASAEDVTALLNRDMTRKSDLCEAIIQFRKDWAPRILTEPCMHYNYASLQHAFKLLNDESDNLQTGVNDYDKIHLVGRQLIGFEMRRLPGIDRCVMAQGIYDVIDRKQVIARSYKFKNSVGDFPIIASDDSIEGLGGDSSVGMYGTLSLRGDFSSPGGMFGELMSNKNFKLANLLPPQPVYQPTGCCVLL